MLNSNDSLISTWNREEAKFVLLHFSRQYNLSLRGAKFLRMAMNALFYLPDQDIVIRIHHPTKSKKDIQIEIDTSNFLVNRGFNSIQVSKLFPNIYRFDQNFITVWNFIKEGNRPDNIATQFGSFLQNFHDLFKDFQSPLSPFSPLQIIEKRLNAIQPKSRQSKHIKKVLLNEYKNISKEQNEIAFVFDKGPIHGDAHTGNIIWSDKKLYLLDYENISYASRDYDLIPMCVISKRFRPDINIDCFLNAYQAGLTFDSIDQRLIRLRELFMLTWLSQAIEHDKNAKNELLHRIDTLNLDGDSGLWHPM